MTCLRACGSGHHRCSAEATELHARRISGSAAGPSSQHSLHTATQPGRLQSHSWRSRRSQQLSAVSSAECETPARSQLPRSADLQHLQAMLDSSNHYPLSAYSPWRAGLPNAVNSSTIQQLLRPVGGLLHLAVQLEERPPPVQHEDEERRKRQNYYANVGDAVRTLREEIPLLFQRDLTYDIYRDDVVFKDPRNTLRGKKNYERIFRGLRIFGRVCFTRCHVDVRRIWQPETNRISMRWQFHGAPRVPWEVEGRLDGVSEFKLDRVGKIYEHSVTNVILRDPPLGISPLWTALSRIFNPQPQPCPGINFEDVPEGQLTMPVPLASESSGDRWIILHRALQRHESSQPHQDLILLE